MIVEHDLVPMIEQIDQIMNALLDHDLIVAITSRHADIAEMYVEATTLARPPQVN